MIHINYRWIFDLIKDFNTNSPLFSMKVSLLVCILLGTFAFLIGVLENSLTMTTNGIIAMGDVASSLILINALSRSIKGSDHNFNYGYGKYEAFALLFSGVILIGVLFFTLYETFSTLIGSTNIVDNHWILLLYSTFSLLVMRRMYLYQKKKAKEINQQIIKYDSDLWKADSIVEIGIIISLLIGIIIEYFNYPIVAKYFDLFAAIILVSFALRVPIKGANKAYNQLLDRTLPENIQFDLISIIAEHLHKMCEYRTMHTRQSGSDIFVELDIVMPWHYTLEKKLEIELELKNKIIAKYNNAIVRVYVIPCNKECILSDGTCHCPILKSNSNNE